MVLCDGCSGHQTVTDLRASWSNARRPTWERASRRRRLAVVRQARPDGCPTGRSSSSSMPRNSWRRRARAYGARPARLRHAATTLHVHVPILEFSDRDATDLTGAARR
jgi:hypothetical protein